MVKKKKKKKRGTEILTQRDAASKYPYSKSGGRRGGKKKGKKGRKKKINK